jgi:hypothetical protein
MGDLEGGVTRRGVVSGIGAAAGAALVASRGIGGAGASAGPRSLAASRPLLQQLPTLTSTELQFTNLPPIAFGPPASTVAWTASGGTLVASSAATFTAALIPSVNDWFQVFDVYLNPGGQTGIIKLTRYQPLSPGISEDLVSGVYPAPVGPLVFHLDHRADPMFWNYVVSIELKPGVVLYGANLWYHPLGARFVQLVAPLRAYDSRFGDGTLASGQQRGISLESVAPVPGAGSALINLTIDQTEGSGYLTVWSPVGEDGSGPPNTSNINWSASNQILANLVVVKLVGDHGDRFSVLAGGNGRTHVIVDVMGYFI